MRRNAQIRLPTIRLILEDGKQAGIVSREEALRLAREAGLDLVEIVPGARPPVCKILDYGKYKYEESKREKSRKKKQHTTVTKEIKMRLKIDKHDYDIKLVRAQKFLIHGYKVKLRLFFRGREIVYARKGIELLTNFAEALTEKGKISQPAKKEGRQVTALIIPKG